MIQYRQDVIFCLPQQVDNNNTDINTYSINNHLQNVHSFHI